MTRYLLGVDPGVTTGIARLHLDTGPSASAWDWDLLQVTPGAVLEVLAALAPTGSLTALALEGFVVGPRAARTSDAAAGRTTRNLIGAVTELGAALGVRVITRSASEVKPWAVDRRLVVAGVRPHRGMPHAKDASRHALYAAVCDLGFPDPLSTAFRSPR